MTRILIVILLINFKKINIHSPFFFYKGSFTLFLIIYAQRRGLLEVWNIEDGTRQLFKNVGLGCQILYSPTPLGDTSSQSKLSKCFILYKDGTLEQVIFKFIPLFKN